MVKQTRDEAMMAKWRLEPQVPEQVRAGGDPREHVPLGWVLRLKECIVRLEPRPGYCDRCKWVAYVDCYGFPTNPSPIDGCDFWPRPYMHLHVAKSEVVDWALGRNYEPA